MKNRGLGGHRPSWSMYALSVVMCGLMCAACKESPPEPSAADRPKDSPPATVAGLGRIEPGDGVVRVAARAPSGLPIISRLLVRKGDTVQKGQVLAELDNKDELSAAVEQATAQIRVARSRLVQARTGAKPSELAAQHAEIGRLEGELENARTEHQRYASLGTNVTAVELDRLKLRVESTTRALAAARQRLTSLTDVRQVDVDLAQAELDEAIRGEARARANAKTSVIHAPISGRVIDIHALPGEQVGADGVLELAPPEPMYAIAEIVESDIARVRVGQRATIRADTLDKSFQGTVERISTKVLQSQVMPVNPANFSDSRVVEVWVRVDDSRAVADFIHLRVDVVIHT